MIAAPTRPVLRYHGGKWMLAPWIIEHFPRHRTYVGPFGGAASVLLQKPRAYHEVYNDLDADLVNLFRLLRNPRQAGRLKRACVLTAFAREEFSQAYEPTDDPLERARRLVVRSFMGFGNSGGSGHRRTGFRAWCRDSGSTPAHDWKGWPLEVPAIVERLRGVTVENEPALKVMARHDGDEALHYVDPPYPHQTRSTGNAAHRYRHEMTDAEHADLLASLRELRGFVVLSGYPCRLYDDAMGGWHRVERDSLADGARARTEVLYLSPRTAEALAGRQTRLFA